MDSKRIAAGVMPICTKTGRICLVQRNKIQSHPETWSCFGGSFDPEEDKTHKEAAHREFREETLYFGSYKLSAFPFHVGTEGDLTFYTYLGFFDHEFTPDIKGAGEGIDYGWYKIDSLPDNLIPGMNKLLKEKGKYLNKIIAFYKKKH